MSLDRARALRQTGQHEEARALLLKMLEAQPDDAATNFEAACVHDSLGYEREALPYYRRALEGELSEDQRRSAYLGLGSTLRALGEAADAQAVFERGLSEFPGSSELVTFGAMALYNLGESKRACEILLELIAENLRDGRVLDYARAIKLYAQDLDRSWP
jgi:tetratricopeptide (TPR) repeat protein